MRLEKYRQAIADFNRALEKNSRLRRPYYYRAVSKLSLSDTTAAMSDLSRALETDSTFINAYITRGRVYHQRHHPDKALDDFNQALAISPDNAKARINRSMTYYELDSIRQAMSDLDHVVEKQPSNALAYYNRALLKTRIGAYDEAISDYNQVLKYNPQNILTYFNRGVVRMKTGEYGKAIRDFTMSVKLYPNFAKAYINRSLARKKLEDHKGARQDRLKAQQITRSYRDNQLQKINFADTSENFRRLISLQNSRKLPRHFGNIDQSVEPKGIFSLYLKNNNQQNLRERIRQYLDRDKESPELSYLDRNFLLEVEAPENQSPQFIRDQIRAISDSIDINPGNARFYLKRALLKKQIKNYNGALKDINRISDLQKDHFLVHFIKGNIRNEMITYIRMMGDDSKIMDIQLDGSLIKEPLSREVTFHDYKKVIAHYNKSIQLAPRFVFSYYNRANAKIQNRNFKGAINDYDKAIFLDKDFARAYFNRGLTYIYLQQNTKGCIDISKAGELGMDEAYTVIKLYCQ
jgi:tetratricopeptide (TPR) repeat protein